MVTLVPDERHRTARPGRPSHVRGLALLASAGVAVAVVHPPPLVVLLVVGLVVMGLSVLARPDFATRLVLGLVYSNAAVVMVRVHGAPSVVAVLVFAPLLLPLVHHLILRREPIVWLSATTWCCLYALVVLLSGLFSPTIIDTPQYLLVFATEGLALFLLLTNVIRSRVQLRWCLAVLVGVGALLGAVALGQYLRGSYWTSFGGFGQVGGRYVPDASSWSSWADGTVPEGRPRLAGPIGEPNFFALVLLGLLPYAGYLATSTTTRVARAGWIAAGALVAIGVVLTYSRGAIIAVVLTTVVLALTRVIHRRSLIVVAAVAAVALALVPSYLDRLSEVRNVLHLGGGTSSGQVADTATKGRFSEMSAGLAVFRDHPVLGVGPGQFPAYYQEYAGISGDGIHAGDGDRQAHNLVVGIAAETGVLGLLTFFGLVVTVLRRLLRLRHQPEHRALAVSAITSLALLLSSSMFLHLAYMRFLWVHLALTALLPVVCTRAAAPEPAR